MTNNPDSIIEHSLSCCKECGHTLENVEVEAYERRQVFDISPVNLIVTEHQSQIKTCPHCGRSNKAVFPESVKYPVLLGNSTFQSKNAKITRFWNRVVTIQDK